MYRLRHGSHALRVLLVVVLAVVGSVKATFPVLSAELNYNYTGDCDGPKTYKTCSSSLAAGTPSPKASVEEAFSGLAQVDCGLSQFQYHALYADISAFAKDDQPVRVALACKCSVDTVYTFEDVNVTLVALEVAKSHGAFYPTPLSGNCASTGCTNNGQTFENSTCGRRSVAFSAAPLVFTYHECSGGNTTKTVTVDIPAAVYTKYGALVVALSGLSRIAWEMEDGFFAATTSCIITAA